MRHYSEMTREQRTNLLLHMFIQWLATQDLLGVWMDNMMEWEKTYEARNNGERMGFLWFDRVMSNHPVSGAIDFSFNWEGTPQGHSFWESKSSQWSSRCQHIVDYLINLERHRVPT